MSTSGVIRAYDEVKGESINLKERQKEIEKELVKERV